VFARKLENLHAPELPLARLPGHVQDEIAVAHPRPATAAEADVIELAESLLRTRGRLERRREKFAQQHLEQHEQQPREERDAREARDRDAGGTDHRELAAARERPEPEERSDERGDRQQLVGELREIQQ